MTRIILRYLLLLAVCLATSAQDVAAPECPVYRVFDTDHPTSNQYLAPDGCRCVDGMSDMHCHYCSSDDPCPANYTCRSGIVFAEGDTYRSYKCKLTNSLEALFKGGKASFFANITDGSAMLSVFNTESINELHAVDCKLHGCEFLPGATGGKCENVSKLSFRVQPIFVFKILFTNTIVKPASVRVPVPALQGTLWKT